MTTSNNGVAFIKQYEGLVLEAYKAVSSENYWTIGYGHYGADVFQGMTITEDKALELLKYDLKHFEEGVNECVTITIGQNQFDALVSFAYNCGVNALKTSYLLSMINAGNFYEACKEWLLWNKSGGKVLLGLTNRRKAEIDMFNTGIENYQVVDNNGWIAESGQFKLSQDVYLRKGASTSSTVICLLPTGSLVRYEAFKHSGGYIWIKQRRGKEFGYLATGESKDGKRVNYWGVFK